MINLKISKIYMYLVKHFTVTFLFLVFILYDVAQALPAFPGAEGYGANTVGGRGGRVIQVTNLNDSGPGSFREACEASGPRIVVFRTGGTIKLNSDIKIRNPYITIAGQTAPGDGITLRAGSLRIENTHDVIVRGLRMRLGRENGSSKDAFASVNGDGINSNIIVDHCSMSWGTDENISTYGDNHNITFQWCITSEGLMDHSMGFRVGKAGYHSVSIHHNLFVHNNARSPQLAYGSETEVVNNVVYNWATRATSVKADARTNIIGNYYKAGPSTGDNDNETIVFFNTDNPMVYLNGNVGPGRPSSNSGDDWDLVSGGLQSMRSFLPVVSHSCITTQTAEEVFDLVLNNAGVISPRRDSVDLRIIQSVINGSGGMISDPGDVGGWPILDSGTPPQDTDYDGMPDSWEIAQGLNPNDQTDGNGDQDADGYTNIEEYINGLIPVIEVGGTLDSEEPTIPTNLTALAVSSSQINLSWNASTDNVEIIGYMIYRDGSQIATTSNTTYQDTGLSSLTTYTYTISAYDLACNESAKSSQVSAATQPDTTPPTITSVNADSSPTQVVLVFSESLEKSSATNVSNYSIDNGIMVLTATLGSDLKTVTLTTSEHTDRITYILTVNNISDLASPPNVIASNSTVSYTFVLPLVISNLNVESGKAYEIVENGLQNGATVYIDRESILYSSVPNLLEGTTYIKTANNDRGESTASFLTFDVNQEVTVSVAYDDRITTKPSWMTSFTDTGNDIVTTDTTLSVFENDYLEGTVTLGGNDGKGNKSMYTVIIVKYDDSGGSVCTDMDRDSWCVEDGDCNDTDPAINPGATEPCDGIDNNCDGAIDEGCGGCTDSDNDGWCIENGDCNDNDPHVNPGHNDKGGRWGKDGVDNDCNGIIDG